MAVKFPYEYVSSYFEKHGCKLLETVYKGAHFKMRYYCSCGNISFVSFTNFRQGNRCWECRGYKISKAKKHPYEYVSNLFKTAGCELLEKTYKDAHTKLKYACSCGNISFIRFTDFQQGMRCWECRSDKIREAVRHSYSYVYDYFKAQGCVLLDKTYKGNRFKLNYICSCGNISTIQFSNFQNGSRCLKCGFTKTGDALRFDYDYVFNYFRNHGCELLDKAYTGSNENLSYICSCGTKSKIRFSNFRNGCRCKKCGRDKQKEKARASFQYVANYFREQGCFLLEKEYKNSKTKMRYICKCGREASTVFPNFKLSKRCKKCAIEKTRGSGHPRWNFDKTAEERRVERSFSGYGRWVRLIYERDNHTCQLCCKKREGARSIHAHHIKSYNDFPEKRLDLSNGITLCRSCHKKIHGKDTGTRENLNEFLKEKRNAKITLKATLAF